MIPECIIATSTCSMKKEEVYGTAALIDPDGTPTKKTVTVAATATLIYTLSTKIERPLPY